jgi:uncharacterized protein YggE
MIARAALALAVIVAAALPGRAQEAARRITVSGEATVSVEPDLASLRAGVISDAKTARDALDANSKAMNAVMTAVRAIGIPDRDLQTARYAIQPIYDPGRPARDRINGFQATNSLLIKVRAFDKLGEIIDRAVAAGANTVGSVEFIVTEPSKFLDEARKQAIADARRKAALYAAAADVVLGRALIITEQSSGLEPAPLVMLRSSAAAPETPIIPGERSLHVSVNVSFELQH